MMFNYLLEKLENPASYCLCHYSNAVDSIRINLINIMKRINKYYDVGVHRIQWDGKTAGGSQAGSGLYFYRVAINDKQQIRQMIMLK